MKRLDAEMTTWTDGRPRSRRSTRPPATKPVKVSDETLAVIERARRHLEAAPAACSTSPSARSRACGSSTRTWTARCPIRPRSRSGLEADRLEGHRPRQEGEDRVPEAQGHVDHARRHREGLRRRQVRRAAQEARLHRLHDAGRRRHVHRGQEGHRAVGRRHPRSARPTRRDVRARADRRTTRSRRAATTSAASSRTASATTTSSIRATASRRTPRAR